MKLFYKEQLELGKREPESQRLSSGPFPAVILLVGQRVKETKDIYPSELILLPDEAGFI